MDALPTGDAGTRPPTAGEAAVRLLSIIAEAGPRGVIHVARSPDQAERIADILATLAPSLAVLHLPPWDCLPYDRASPSAGVMGRRIATMVRLADGFDGPHAIVSSAPALVQRVPPRATWQDSTLRLRPGDDLDVEALQAFLLRTGYWLDERVDEPGEVAFRGEVVDLFPADARNPVRIDHADGRITGLRRYDPASQRSIGDLDSLHLLPASEAVTAHGEPRGIGLEHALPRLYGRLGSLLDLAPAAEIIREPEVEERLAAFLSLVADAYDTRQRVAGGGDRNGRCPAPADLFLTAEEWRAALDERGSRRLEIGTRAEPPPRFAAERAPGKVFADFARTCRDRGDVMVLTTPPGPVLRRLSRFAERHLGTAPLQADGWDEVTRAAPGDVLMLAADLEEPFRQDGIVVLTAGSLLGSHAVPLADDAVPAALLGATASPQPGESVIHADHGLARLVSLETLDGPDGVEEAARLEFQGGDLLLLPTRDLARVWRYGGTAGDVALDRLGGTSWVKRLDKVQAEVDRLARELTESMRYRLAQKAPVLTPPRPAYERIAGRFPYAETPDQSAAIRAVLEDLSSGRPMDRLICGDVGYGKTEVALRAAAAAALAGRQVAVVAPTTILARQHLETFRDRFAGTDIRIGHLSRLAGTAEARETKAGLKDGSIRIVVGTQALAGKTLSFQNLGLLIVDEEQRFGATDKAKLRRLGEGLHVLTLSATPIPRTLQAAQSGLLDLSLLARPPARRRAVATFTAPWDETTVREAMLRERQRNGQSFVVCPRIEDIGTVAERLSALVPEMEILTAHGRMAANEIDDMMLRFAGGGGDVLLATNIIESGLDVPGANTMLVWRADRFGLSQLHQLRGRVGRGRVRGVCYLLTAPGMEPGKAATERLQTLEAFDRLGAGFEISARDLDLRGAGNLIGDDQSGHARLVGSGLYQHMVARALARVAGDPGPADWAPDIRIGGVPAIVPTDLVPEPEVRLDLYARAARLEGEEDVAAFADELADRFGPPPEALAGWLALVGLVPSCRRHGVEKLQVGPKGAVADFRTDRDRKVAAALKLGDGFDWSGDRLLLRRGNQTPGDRLNIARALLDGLSAA